VLRDAPDAVTAFLTLLGQGATLNIGATRPEVTLEMLVALKPAPGGGGVPCPPLFLIEPSTVALITMGIDRAAAGDPQQREMLCDGLWALWERAALLEEVHSYPPRGGDDRGPLRSFMRLLARDRYKPGR
jgi:hypothetical protein